MFMEAMFMAQPQVSPEEVTKCGGFPQFYNQEFVLFWLHVLLSGAPTLRLSPDFLC